MYSRNWYVYLILAAFGLMFLLPFLVMVLGSLKNIEQAIGSPAAWLDAEFTFQNFVYIFTNNSFARWIFNSVVITFIPVFTQMFLCAALGYIFAKKEFPGKELIFWGMMGVVMMPGQLLIIPRYIMFSEFGWINTYLPLIVPEIWGIMGVFFVRQYMQTLPKDIEEAAYMDGANDFTIFMKVMLPLAKPVVATVGTFSFIQNWNDFFTPLIFMTDSKMFPITVGLASMLNREGNFGIEMAGAVVSFIPTFLIFLFFQRYFVKGIAMSGMK